LVPPDAHERFLAENGSVGAEEVEGFVQGADVEDLATSLNVSVVSWEFLLVTVERSFWDFREDWVVDFWFSGNG
jgi:hypothetical protein